MRRRRSGIAAALASALFLGLSPVFGKLALNFGVSPLTVVAWRTGLATVLVLLFVALFSRKSLYIFPAGLLGCTLAGVINGAGSIFYYMALQKLPASLGQMLYALYPFFVAMWLTLDGQPPSRFTIARIGLAIVGVVLLTAFQSGPTDTLGIVLMLAGAALYALHLPINQRVLYEVPAPTVTLYTLLAMSAVVIPVHALFGHSGSFPAAAWYPLGDSPWSPRFRACHCLSG